MRGSLEYIVFLILIVFTKTGYSQQQISVDDFTVRNIFQPRTVSGINWMKDGKYYTTLEKNQIVRYNISEGTPVEVLISDKDLPKGVTIDEYEFSQDEKKLMLLTERTSIYRRSFVGEYYIFDVGSKKTQKLSQGGKQSYATFSPDGSKVAFVRSNNLFIVNLDDMQEMQVTADGKFNHIINGTTDWVYEEELSFVVGFFWSPDSKKIAYYRFDETDVKEYNMQVWGNEPYPVDYRFKYPKAGEKNSVVEIYVFDLQSSKKIKADIGQEDDYYIPRVQWTADPEVLAVRKMNRLQNELTLLHVSARNGSSQVIWEEKSKTNIDLRFVEDLMYLSDGKHFIGASERSGYKHLYLYTIEGKLIQQITKGDYEVSSFIGYDEKSKMVYYTSTEISPIERHFYRISLTGKNKARLTSTNGQHTINMSPDFKYYIDYHTNSNTPNTVVLYSAKGNKQVRILEQNETLQEKLKAFGFVSKEFFSFPTVDGTLLNGYFLKPETFVAGKKYPIILYQYSGPGSQNAGDVWGGSHFFFHQMLTQKDFIVAVIDTRGTGGRGEHFKKLTYKQLGKYELEDIVATAKYFGSLPFIDPGRIGVWGWSYGGYMTALAMTKGEGLFKTGIAVAPVTNWRFYDTIYTERFLQTPQLNASGYDDNSPSTHAANLKGNFLLIHGTGDDNVHFQNSTVLQDALIQAGKQFQTFYYPDKHHGIQGKKTRQHLYTLMLNYFLEKL